MSAALANAMLNVAQPRRFACDRCHRYKSKCERSVAVTADGMGFSLGSCKRCSKAQVPCQVTTDATGPEGSTSSSSIIQATPVGQKRGNPKSGSQLVGCDGGGGGGDDGRERKRQRLVQPDLKRCEQGRDGLTSSHGKAAVEGGRGGRGGGADTSPALFCDSFFSRGPAGPEDYLHSSSAGGEPDVRNGGGTGSTLVGTVGDFGLADHGNNWLQVDDELYDTFPPLYHDSDQPPSGMLDLDRGPASLLVGANSGAKGTAMEEPMTWINSPPPSELENAQQDHINVNNNPSTPPSPHGVGGPRSQEAAGWSGIRQNGAERYQVELFRTAESQEPVIPAQPSPTCPQECTTTGSATPDVTASSSHGNNNSYLDDCRAGLMELHSTIIAEICSVTDSKIADAFFSGRGIIDLTAGDDDMASCAGPGRITSSSSSSSGRARRDKEHSSPQQQQPDILWCTLSLSERLICLVGRLRSGGYPASRNADGQGGGQTDDKGSTPSNNNNNNHRGGQKDGHPDDATPPRPPLISGMELFMLLNCYVGLLSLYRTIFSKVCDGLLHARRAQQQQGRLLGKQQRRPTSPSQHGGGRLLPVVVDRSEGGARSTSVVGSVCSLQVRLHVEMMTHKLELLGECIVRAITASSAGGAQSPQALGYSRHHRDRDNKPSSVLGTSSHHGELVVPADSGTVTTGTDQADGGDGGEHDDDDDDDMGGRSTSGLLGGPDTTELLGAMLRHEQFVDEDEGQRVGLGSLLLLREKIRRKLRYHE